MIELVAELDARELRARNAELVAALEEIAALRVGLDNGLHGWVLEVREIARAALHAAAGHMS